MGRIADVLGSLDVSGGRNGVPVLRTHRSWLVRNLKAFFKLEAGLAREHAPIRKGEPGRLDGRARRSNERATRSYPPHRAYVGKPEEWDLVAARQVALLLAAGLRDYHRLADVGCGSLRAGRMLIPYLNPERYFGVEPNRWLVEAGIEHELGRDLARIKRPAFRFVDDFSLDGFGTPFDFVMAHSVFSHAYPDLALTGFHNIARSLAPEGKLFATFREGDPEPEGSGWFYPEMVPYAWERLNGIIEEGGLVARRLDWEHPRQSWFVAAHPGAESEIADLSRRLRRPLRGWQTADG